MNQQYMHQAHQQAPQPHPQASHYGGPPGSSPYEALNANVPPGMMKPPVNSHQYPPQKTMPGPPPGNLPPGASPYYNYNAQVNNQQPPPPNSFHGPPPSVNQDNLTNQMSSMALNNAPSVFPPQSATNSAPPPSNINGFSSTDHSPSGPSDPLLPPAPTSQTQSLPPSQAAAANVNRYPGEPPHMTPPSQLGQKPPGPPPMNYPPSQQRQIPGQPPPGQQPPVQQPPVQQPPVQQPPVQLTPQNAPMSGPPHPQSFPGARLPPGPPGNLPPTGPPPSNIGGSLGQPTPYIAYQSQQHQNLQRQMMPGPPMPPQTGLHQPQLPPMRPGGLPGSMPGYQPPDAYSGQRSPFHPQGLNMAGPPNPSSVYQPGVQPQQARRLDPESMPSPIQVMQDDQRTRGGVFITNQKGLAPPFVTTKFVVQDQGNASPRFIRSTIYTVPTTTDIMKQTGVPFGLIVSPMAQVIEDEQDPPIVDMGEIGPVRCIRCKAYMGPFMQFIDAGRRFQCAFCKATTEVPSEYFQHLDHTGQRMDRYERPELMLGTYEFIATKEYCRNATFPKPPAIVFVIDVSYNNVKSGLVNLLCGELKNIIKNLPKDRFQERSVMKVGFITYSNTVHFYNISPNLTQPQMMVVGDVQDVFMPLLDGFLGDPEESEAVIDALLAQIPVMFADTRETETILAPAIQAGLEALKASDCPGKLMVFHSSLPIAEAPGKLKNRDDRKLLGGDKEKTVLAPQSTVYNQLGQECVGVGCSVDLFIFNNSYIDLATIGQVSRLTGGEVYKYTYFQADNDGDRLVTDIINNISRPIAFDAVMRVRTSTGVRPTDFYGHFFMSNTTDMELASIDCNKAVAIEVKHDDKLSDEEGVYVQVALLYTSCGGIRQLRIINLSLKTSSQMAELYRACDPDAVVNFFAKQSVFKLIESTPKAVKDNLISKCATIFAAYRKHCASPFSASQLVLPECMKLLPLYVNCLLKSDAISGGADMTIDDRTFVMMAVATMPLYTSVNYFYPRLLPLHDIDLQANELPQQLRCSIDKFAEDGAYLLENGIHMFLWLGHALSAEWIQAVFGAPVVDTERTSIPILDNQLNIHIREIIARVRTERHHCMRLTIVRQRDKLEMVLRHFLVEDRGNDNSQSYVDFLCHMHKEIKTLLSN
ncbi:protein transport protein Sec24D [Fopius arisanus]|uniref:Protein transport protein Sec24D n=1 Tax=Fopius arisanus TaxID=64838 RepID=A0A9R1STA6_9HYME|nr:PREDICTED: protein transport protein Sec24D [Fopius arisanus]XP_011296760.1 PREDICTED: protein transport protein Sec24D [Fopius arisanus]